ncbi:MAG: hypothetical protein QM270_10310 [Bacillota bacterium]|nr:hypothetical protein [Bacillota bacterium]
MQSTSPHRLHRLIILAVILFFTASAIAITVLLLQAPVTPPPGVHPAPKTRGAYTIHLAQALAGIILTPLAGLLDRRSRLAIPPLPRSLFAIFLLCALGLGSAWSLCEVIAGWDKLLHASSAALLTLLGAGLLHSRLPNGKTDIGRTTTAGFCFAGTAGVFWEFFEFLVDSLLGLNSQRFRAPDGTALCGQAALLDTMGDLLTNTLGALGMALILTLLFRHDSRRIDSLLPGIRPARSSLS